MDPVRILETEGKFPFLEYFCESWRTAKHHLWMSWPMETGYNWLLPVHHSQPAALCWENTCVLCQAVLAGFAFGLGSHVTSSSSLVRWEKMSHNSSHSRMCAVPLLTDDKRDALCPAFWPWSLGRRKRRGSHSACRQPDSQLHVGGAWLLCPYGQLGRGTDSPGERVQKAAGPELSCLARAFPYSPLLLEGTGG